MQDNVLLVIVGLVVVSSFFQFFVGKEKANAQQPGLHQVQSANNDTLVVPA